jgi:XTP/dITP diphosphohydrolase
MMVLATRSGGKLRELRPLLSASGIEVSDLDDAEIAESPAEDDLEIFATFEENALAKAKYFYSLTGRPTVADDSGLVVDALGGAPGVLSKRWSGRTDLSGQALDDENNRLLIERLRGQADRRARYVCAAAYVDAKHAIVCRGESAGWIAIDPVGRGGFGYDPYVVSTELGETFASATREEKERVSHRGRAFRALLARLHECGVIVGDTTRLGS